MNDLLSELKSWRRDLHQIPELGLQEEKTTEYLKKQLILMGYEPFSTLDTGVAVYIDNNSKETIAFRSDIDALIIDEATNCGFESKHVGKMHACGHDGHMSALLGFAKALKNNNGEYSYNLLLIFQPAEESPGGAKLLIESGLLKQYHVKAIFGMHLMPTIDEGIVACRSGALMAQNGELDVTIHGKSAHAGLYHQGIDSIMIATQLINQYQTIITRNIAPVEPCVINIGEIHGGTIRNIVADKTTFKGTIRVYSEEVFNDITTKIQKINNSMEDIYGCKIDYSCPSSYPAVINDTNLYNKFVNLVGDNYLELKDPLMLAEDFSYYQKEVPGIFFFLGTRTKQYCSGLHTETFNFNESVLKVAVDLYLKIATQLKLEE